MNIYLLNYNNYYNRICKKEDTLTSDNNTGNDEPDGKATESCKKNESSIFNFDLL